MIKLVQNWRAVLAHAWSVRILALAAVLSGIEVALPFVGAKLPIPDAAKAFVFFSITAGALVSRFVAQEKLKVDDP